MSSEARVGQLLGAMSRAEAARRLGLTVRHLRRLEQADGKRAPHRTTREAFLSVFGADPWEGRGAGRGPADDDHEQLGRRLLARRRELGLSQQQVADRGRRRAPEAMKALRNDERRLVYCPGSWVNPDAWLSAATVSRMENGRPARWESRFALAVALDIDYETWFGPLNLPEAVSVLDDLEDIVSGLGVRPGLDR